MHSSTPTERAITDTRDAFRACYNHGLIYDPTQDGHVAIVLRIGGDGRVASVESWGACEIVEPAIECMRDAAKKLRFCAACRRLGHRHDPRRLYFVRRGTSDEPAPSDVYAASAYIAVEGIRPAAPRLREERAAIRGSRRRDRDLQPGRGRAGKGGALEHRPLVRRQGPPRVRGGRVRGGLFPPPGAAAGLIVRLAFNPRAGTK